MMFNVHDEANNNNTYKSNSKTINSKIIATN